MANESDPDALANAAEATASKWSNEAELFLSTLQALAGTGFTVNPPHVFGGISYTTRDNEMATAISGQPSKPSGLAFSNPTDPGDAPTVDISEVTEVALPDYDLASPTLDLPTRPDPDTPVKPAAPAIKSVDVPSAPTLTTPTAPTLVAVSFPDSPSIQLPSFSESFPVDPGFLLQTTQFSWNEPEVSHPLLDEAGDLLLSDLQNGGYGIHEDDENALWERARDREHLQLASAEELAMEDFASRGFTMPHGAAHAAVQRAREEAGRNLSAANREIAIARADLMRQARQFAITQGVAVDDAKLRHAGFRLERALNAARFSAEFAISVHDAGVRAYNVRVQAYASFAEAYRSQLQGELAKVQIFEAEVRAAVSQQESQRIEVELYNALINAQQASVSLYETRVRAMVAELDGERVKMDAFRSQVEAFVAEVRANAVEFDAYEAGVRGEQAKVTLFSEQVGAYRSRVEAARIESEVRNKQVDVDLERTRTEAVTYASAVDAYRGRVAAETSRVEALLREYNGDTEVYRAAMSAWEGLVRVTVAEIDAIARQVESQTRLEQENVRLTLRSQIEQAASKFRAANAGSEIAKAFTALAGESLGMLSAKVEEI